MVQLNTTRRYNKKDRNTGEERNWNPFTGRLEIKTAVNMENDLTVSQKGKHKLTTQPSNSLPR